jgi:hypothetical protein
MKNTEKIKGYNSDDAKELTTIKFYEVRRKPRNGKRLIHLVCFLKEELIKRGIMTKRDAKKKEFNITGYDSQYFIDLYRKLFGHELLPLGSDEFVKSKPSGVLKYWQ